MNSTISKCTLQTLKENNTGVKALLLKAAALYHVHLEALEYKDVAQSIVNHIKTGLSILSIMQISKGYQVSVYNKACFVSIKDIEDFLNSGTATFSDIQKDTIHNIQKVDCLEHLPRQNKNLTHRIVNFFWQLHRWSLHHAKTRADYNAMITDGVAGYIYQVTDQKITLAIPVDGTTFSSNSVFISFSDQPNVRYRLPVPLKQCNVKLTLRVSLNAVDPRFWTLLKDLENAHSWDDFVRVSEKLLALQLADRENTQVKAAVEKWVQNKLGDHQDCVDKLIDDVKNVENPCGPIQSPDMNCMDEINAAISLSARLSAVHVAALKDPVVALKDLIKKYEECVQSVCEYSKAKITKQLEQAQADDTQKSIHDRFWEYKRCLSGSLGTWPSIDNNQTQLNEMLEFMRKEKVRLQKAAAVSESQTAGDFSGSFKRAKELQKDAHLATLCKPLLDALEAVIKSEEQRRESLLKDIEDLLAKLKGVLQTINDTCTPECEEFKEECANLKQEIVALKTRMEEVKTQISSHQINSQDAEARLTSLRQKSKQLQSALERFKTSKDSLRREFDATHSSLLLQKPTETTENLEGKLNEFKKKSERLQKTGECFGDKELREIQGILSTFEQLLKEHNGIRNQIKDIEQTYNFEGFDALSVERAKQALEKLKAAQMDAWRTEVDKLINTLNCYDNCAPLQAFNENCKKLRQEILESKEKLPENKENVLEGIQTRITEYRAEITRAVQDLVEKRKQELSQLPDENTANLFDGQTKYQALNINEFDCAKDLHEIKHLAALKAQGLSKYEALIQEVSSTSSEFDKLHGEAMTLREYLDKQQPDAFIKPDNKVHSVNDAKALLTPLQEDLDKLKLEKESALREYIRMYKIAVPPAFSGKIPEIDDSDTLEQLIGKATQTCESIKSLIQDTNELISSTELLEDHIQLLETRLTQYVSVEHHLTPAPKECKDLRNQLDDLMRNKMEKAIKEKKARISRLILEKLKNGKLEPANYGSDLERIKDALEKLPTHEYSTLRKAIEHCNVHDLQEFHEDPYAVELLTLRALYPLEHIRAIKPGKETQNECQVKKYDSVLLPLLRTIKTHHAERPKDGKAKDEEEKKKTKAAVLLFRWYNDMLNLIRYPSLKIELTNTMSHYMVSILNNVNTEWNVVAPSTTTATNKGVGKAKLELSMATIANDLEDQLKELDDSQKTALTEVILISNDVIKTNYKEVSDIFNAKSKPSLEDLQKIFAPRGYTIKGATVSDQVILSFQNFMSTMDVRNLLDHLRQLPKLPNNKSRRGGGGPLLFGGTTTSRHQLRRLSKALRKLIR